MRIRGGGGVKHQLYTIGLATNGFQVIVIAAQNVVGVGGFVLELFFLHFFFSLSLSNP